MNAPNPLPTEPVLSPGRPFHLVSVMEQRLPLLKRRPKRLRTRAQILAATAREMERVGYDGLTVELITEALGIARGTFYLHFRDRSHAAMTVIRIYVALRRRCRPRGGRTPPVAEAILLFNSYYVAVYALNAKLLLGRESLMRDRSELAQARDRLNEAWARTVVEDVLRRDPRPRDPQQMAQLQLRVRGAIAMSDELLREIYLVRAPGLEPYLDDEPMVVSVLSDMWLRIVYASAPE